MRGLLLGLACFTICTYIHPKSSQHILDSPYCSSLAIHLPISCHGRCPGSTLTSLASASLRSSTTSRERRMGARAFRNSCQRQLNHLWMLNLGKILVSSTKPIWNRCFDICAGEPTFKFQKNGKIRIWSPKKFKHGVDIRLIENDKIHPTRTLEIWTSVICRKL